LERVVAVIMLIGDLNEDVAAAHAICACGDCFDAKIIAWFCRRQISVDRHHCRGKSDKSNRAFHCLSVTPFVLWNLNIPL
jgi:hypothetical protein